MVCLGSSLLQNGAKEEGAPQMPIFGRGKKERRERGLSCKKSGEGPFFKKGAPLQLQVETHTEFAKKENSRVRNLRKYFKIR